MPVNRGKSVRSALVCALMTGRATVHQRALDALCARFGPMALQSDAYAIDAAGYYAREMGGGLSKQLFCFSSLVDTAALCACKEAAMEIEQSLTRTVDGVACRTANIDPGLLSLESLVLSTTKRVGHRICIGTGIWAETTLLYQKGGYRSLPWTYLDYQSDLVQDFLMDCRQWLRGALRAGENSKMDVT